MSLQRGCEGRFVGLRVGASVGALVGPRVVGLLVGDELEGDAVVGFLLGALEDGPPIDEGALLVGVPSRTWQQPLHW
jgi:hypothetical protein